MINDRCRYVFLLRIILGLMVLLWCVFIFSNSFKPAAESSEQSEGFLVMVEEVLQKYDEDIEISNHFVRKAAHFTEFFVLGALLTLSALLWKKDKPSHFVHTATIGLLVALTDETIQLFSNGRDGSVADVWLDFSAVVIVHILVFAIILTVKHIKFKKGL